jgi:hypothetical protein
MKLLTGPTRTSKLETITCFHSPPPDVYLAKRHPTSPRRIDEFGFVITAGVDQKKQAQAKAEVAPVALKRASSDCVLTTGNHLLGSHTIGSETNRSMHAQKQIGTLDSRNSFRCYGVSF